MTLQQSAIPVRVPHHEELDALRATLRDWCRRSGAGLARKCAEQGAGASLSKWSELAALGVFGAHLPESAGGSGFGALGAAAVLEECAYALIPGPVLPTLLAAELLHRYGSAETDQLLHELVTGSLRAAVAWTATAVVGAGPASLSVTGELGPVLGAPDADVLVLAVEQAGSLVCCVVDLRADGAEVLAVEGLDPTRSVGTVRLRGAVTPGGWLLRGLTRQVVRERVAVHLAAESAGIAAWALDTAVAHAKTRVQFGRPIGSFQAVNHHCVDLLTHREQAGAVTWRAATADDTGRAFASAVAACVAPAAAYESAKTCIQVLGAIGFSWEHGAHLRLRRASANRQLAGRPAGWQRLLVERAPDAMTSGLGATGGTGGTAQGTQLPDEVWADVLRAAAAPADQVQRMLADTGLLAPGLPRPFGLAASPAQQLAVRTALRTVGVAVPDLVIGKWALATIAAAGSEGQRARLMHPTLRGEIAWCQLFSEPEAGSDLASLRTTATRVDGGWSLTGHKIWTSRAQTADWAICLARVPDDGAGRSGITYFLVPMRAPGVRVRPLRNAAGDYRFNEVFLDGVVVTDDLVVGEVGEGWRVARTTLDSERIEMSDSRFGVELDVILALLAAVGAAEADAGNADAANADAANDGAAQVGGLIAEAMTLAAIAAREADDIGAGTQRSGAAEVRKLTAMAYYQRSTEVAMDLLGERAIAVAGDTEAITHDFLDTRGLTIGGGTTEVLKTAVGERVLGLPRGRRHD